MTWLQHVVLWGCAGYALAADVMRFPCSWGHDNFLEMVNDQTEYVGTHYIECRLVY